MGIARVADNNSRFHMRELQISQNRIYSDSESPSYSLSFAVEEYTLDVDLNRTYTGNIDTHVVAEFYGDAIAKMMAGNNNHVNALGAIQLTIADYLLEEFGYIVEIV